MKELLKLILPLAGKWRLWTNVFLGIFSGLCNFLFINLVTRVIGLIIAGNLAMISREYIVLFCCIILLFIWTRRILSLTIIELSQKMFWSLRKQVLWLVLSANYRKLAGKKDKIYSTIVNDVNVLTQTSLTVIDFFTSLILAISCFVYLASLSFTLFLITLGVALFGMAVYHFGSRNNVRQFRRARELETTFLNSLNAILDGSKEIYMEPRKGWSIYDHKIIPVADEAYKGNKAAFTGYLDNQITGRILFYILISAILLLFSVTLNIKTGNLVSFVFTLLYLLGSIEMVMSLLPGLVRAKIAAGHLVELKKELEEAHSVNPLQIECFLKEGFDRITIRDLEFRYEENEQAFGIGPVNLEINKREVIFIYGGNGSGKTTFIYALLGLYIPSGGEVRVNDVPVNKGNYVGYRKIFSVIFSDFYLFDELLGADHFDRERWDRYLHLFELEGKVSIENNCFSTISLSTGQKKRLALIAILLEAKPVLIIDEWAADQDPYFRKKFYTEIIPLLKEEGFTIIAITHDDRYYSCADKLYKMDSGKLVREDLVSHERGLMSIF